ncbi:MAG: PepSY domain-containing protein, partial [Planctomycetota bacterium]
LFAPTLEGTVTRTPLDPADAEEETEKPPFPNAVEAPITSVIEAISKAVKQETGAERVLVRRAPRVEFAAVVEGEEWIVSCDLRTGGITARKPGEPTREIETRSFLTRLHVSRGYPGEFTARTVWAVAVDVTAGLMIFWAVSGIAMWWQLRPTRKAGALAAIAGLIGAGILGYAMFLIFYY